MAVTEAVIAVTGKCNARCEMCDIWQRPPGDQVEPSFYYHLPPTLTNVNITGGEPFLRKDLAEIILVISDRCRKVRPVISTNGLLSVKAWEMVPELLRINSKTAVRVSIDGIGKIHDTIRGVDGAYEKAIYAIEKFKKIGIRDVGIGFTMSRGNEEQMDQVYALSRKLGIQFTSTVAHSSPIFFGDQNDVSPDPEKAAKTFTTLKNRQLASLHPKNWFRAYFTDGVLDTLAKNPRRVNCPALVDFFFLDPGGRVYPCHVLDAPIGYLPDMPFEQMVRENPKILAKVQNCPIHCWMTCTVAPGMRKRPWIVLRWIAGAQAKRVLGFGDRS